MTSKPHAGHRQRGADEKPIPSMAAYKVFNYPDQAGTNAAIRAGQVDYMGPGVVSLDVLSLRDVKKDRPDLVYWDGQLANFTGIEFNMKKAPWNDVKVRRAIALGIDKDEGIPARQFPNPTPPGLFPLPLTA